MGALLDGFIRRSVTQRASASSWLNPLINISEYACNTHHASENSNLIQPSLHNAPTAGKTEGPF
jgi:hypothetical protein